MIIFKSVSYCNFLSTGNTPNVIYLDRSPSTLITGTNGAGKSTLLDALCFGLFNKPFRNINRPQLINSVNEKAMEVIVEFEINNNEYKIVRGVKPNKFEIWTNGQLINQDASNRDYQKRLEQILKLNFKSFTQIVILGSAAFKPFMQLSNIERREIIEDLLDITVFSRMNIVLSNRKSENKLNIRENDYEKEITQTKINGQKGLISNIQNRNKASKEKLEKEIIRNENKITVIQEKIERLDKRINTKLDKALNISEIRSNLDEAKSRGKILLQHKSESSRLIDFYNEHDHCDTCGQDIAEEHKCQMTGDLTTKKDKATSLLELAANAFNKMESKLSKAQEQADEIQLLQVKRNDYTSEISTMQQLINQSKQNLDVETDANSLREAKQGLRDLEKDIRVLDKRGLVLLEEKHHLEICRYLLKDSGIKAKIIAQYLPVMNTLVNQNLDKMGANYSFHLLDDFTEEIKSRYRDNFSYASFSEGEKLRIDLALMFTWREIAKMKNSIHTNLLILDEIGDSSLDHEATDALWELLAGMSDTNVYVISHKSNNGDRFKTLLEFTKDGNFSHIKDSIAPKI